MSVKTPVVLIVFNRPEPTRQVFEAIRAHQPDHLLVIADGPRENRRGEHELCRQVREIVSHVDWPCKLQTDFSDVNQGCDPRIVSGLDWAFRQVDEAIILEDDCLPDPSFFPFCAEMLDRFRGDDRVAAISGTNLVQDEVTSDDSYFFSMTGGNWGWATWKTQWQTHDRLLLDWPALRRGGYLAEFFRDPPALRYWEEIFDECFRDGERSPWDYRWLYTRLFAHRLTVVPRVNLIRNIGFGADATHTHNKDSRRMPPVGSLAFPLKHPPCMLWSQTLDERSQRKLYNTLPRKALRRARLAGARLFGPKLFRNPV